jgi:lantibiotic modifying enzyme
MALAGGRWQPVAGTLGPDLGSGTAGVGWVLARLAAATGDGELADVAAAALRHAVARADGLLLAGRLDWYHGAAGVAWAAVDAGRALADAGLAAAGADAARAVVRAAGDRRGEPDDLGLAGGASGEVAGLLALAALGPAGGALEAAVAAAARLAAAFERAARLDAGLARGVSGVALALAAAAAATGSEDARAAAARAFAAERPQFEPGHGWIAPPAHPWLAGPAAARAGWCGGAAGIGLARLAGWRALGDPMLLAETGAAVELVRAHLIAPPDQDASLCHGAAGAIELLVAAGTLLGEPEHARAARAAGRALVERARSHGRYGAGTGPAARNPSLLFGLAGTAALMLRLHDPAALPSPALPPP